MSRPHLVFVHVGKCAGSSISSSLFRGGERFTELHGLSKFPHMRELVRNPSLFFLVSVRDPIRRFQSSFCWDRWEKRESKVVEDPQGLWKAIFDTFATPNDLAESLSSTDEQRRALARSAFQRSYLHMHMGLSWYLPLAVAEALPLERSAVIRVENIEEDFASFAVKYGLERPSRFFPLPREKSSYRGKPGEDLNSLSDSARSNLKAVLAPDYAVLECLAARGLLGERFVPAPELRSIVRGGLPRIVPDSVANYLRIKSRGVLRRILQANGGTVANTDQRPHATPPPPWRPPAGNE